MLAPIMKNAPTFLMPVVYATLALALLPEPLGAQRERRLPAGLLTAYTGTSTYDSGQIDYFPHTGYRIFHADGRYYRDVRNHTNSTDELPYTIAIPAGDYFMLAKSETQGGVKVPFAVKPGRWTVVRLDNPTRNGKIPPNVEVIRLPEGEVAGWKFERRAPKGLLNQRAAGLKELFTGS
jgi:hypothetical protein